MEIKKPAKKSTTLPKLKAKLDGIFSRYVRLYHADRHGYCECYTCGKRMHWTKIQNGHLFSRGRLKTRWDPMNCRPQCYGCNVAQKGNYQEYFPRFIEELGIELLRELEYKSKQPDKLTRIEYERLIAYYTKEVKELIDEKGDTE